MSGPMMEREPLRVKLSDGERGFYSNMFQQINPEEKREVDSKTIVQFLMTSGLELPKLKNIWDIAARTSNDFLLKEEFYCALRLVAYMQNNLPANENSIRTNLTPPLPRFDDYKPSTPGADPVRPGQ